MEASNQKSSNLARVIGIPGAIGLGLGSILGTGVFVSLAIVTGVAGPWAPIAVGLAGLLATCNGLSSAQLAAAHPVSGGTYEYGHKFVHPMAGYVAGWMFLVAKSASAATAALGFAAYLSQGVSAVSDLISPVNLALLLVALITLLTAGGLRRSNAVNSVIVLITLGALASFVFAGINHLTSGDTASDLSLQILSDHGFQPSSLMHATALAFVAYAGYGRIATMGEEVVEPRRTIPRAIIATLAVSMLTYMTVVIVSVAAVGPETFSTAGQLGKAPLEQVARYLEQPTIASLIAVGATLAMAGVLLNLVLGLSRVLLAMARRKEMPQSLSVLTPGGESPKRAVWVVGAGIAGLVSIGDITTTWSLSAFCVLIYYGTTNLAALKMPEEQRLYPKWISWAGLFGCLSLAFFIDVQTIIVGIAAIGLAVMLKSLQARAS